VQRQAIERDCVLQAEAEAEASLGKDDNVPVIVTAAEGWHPGVVGLVAARLRERYGRPSFAIALGAGGVGTGSGRSIPGADLGQVVRQAVADGLLLKGGGHAMAAGVTLHKDRLAQFRAFLEDALRAPVTAARREDLLSIDGAVSAAGVTVELCNLLARGGPYGSGNPEPILALPNHTIAFADPVGENHVRVRLRSLDGAFVNAIAFRAADKPLGRALLENRGRAVHAAGCLAVDRYQGTERVQFRVIDIAAA
jgi:single-stranded-DNA-specific exonuclease